MAAAPFVTNLETVSTREKSLLNGNLFGFTWQVIDSPPNREVFFILDRQPDATKNMKINIFAQASGNCTVTLRRDVVSNGILDTVIPDQIYFNQKHINSSQMIISAVTGLTSNGVVIAENVLPDDQEISFVGGIPIILNDGSNCIQFKSDINGSILMSLTAVWEEIEI